MSAIFMSLKPSKIMFIDTVHPVLEEELTKMGFKCDDFTGGTQEEIEAKISDYQGVVIRSKFTFNAKMIDLASNLKFIARSGSGLENIDTKYAASKNIKCFNSPEGNRDAVAEQCIGMLLCLFNNIVRANQQVKNGIWLREENRGIELKGKTVGLIGYGKMGEAFAKRLSGFDVKVIAYDKYKKDYSDKYVTEVSIKDIFEQTDVLSIHVNYLEENYHLINETFINKFQKKIYLINTSRGKSLDTIALMEGLKNKKILGACLDVLEIENNAFEKNTDDHAVKILTELSSYENVILSPHVAGWTTESYYKLSKVLAEKIKSHYNL